MMIFDDRENDVKFYRIIKFSKKRMRNFCAFFILEVLFTKGNWELKHGNDKGSNIEKREIIGKKKN